MMTAKRIGSRCELTCSPRPILPPGWPRLSAAAYAAGLLHDLGKYTPEFQKRLTGTETPVDHATAGARAMLEHLAADPENKLMAERIAYAIAGHHAVFPDRKNDIAACLDLRVKQSLPALDPAWKAEIGESVSGLAHPSCERCARKTSRSPSPS